MADKNKTFRVDDGIAAGFEAWCEARGLKEQAVGEALLLFVQQRNPDELFDLLKAVSEYKQAQAEAAPAKRR